MLSQRIRQVMAQVRQCPTDQRSDLMSRLCGQDEDLRQGVEEALRTESLPAMTHGENEGAQVGASQNDQETRIQDRIDDDAVAASKHAPNAEPALPVIPGYKVVREISRGGQAIVLLAIQDSTGRKVAIKVLRHGAFATSNERARFDREVRVLASLDHPNIVHIIDRGRTGDAGDFLVMQYVSGSQLDDWLTEYYRTHPEGPPPSNPAEMLSLFLKICAAVETAHQRGVVHRDLKPGNIRIDPSGEPHILDFGLAHVSLNDKGAVTLTGQFLGSLAWASPEQAAGKTNEIDARTDVYALGVILYQMLTGRFPYQVAGAMRDVLNNIVNAQPQPPSSIHRDATESKAVHGQLKVKSGKESRLNPTIDAIVLKALSKRSEDRYATAGAMAKDLLNYLAGKPVEATHPAATVGPPVLQTEAAEAVAPVASRPPRFTLAPRSWKRAIVTALLAGLLTAAACGAAYWMQYNAAMRQINAPTNATDKPAAPLSGITPLPKNVEDLDLGNGITLQLLRVSPGEFLMGSELSAEEVARRFGANASSFDDELPQHKVVIPRGFLMGKYEVTRGQFRQFVADSGYGPDAWRQPGFEQEDNHPVVNVNWHDAVAFCAWLSKRSGATVRLPTDAEWEYAARAGTKMLFPWGTDPNDGTGWANANDQVAKSQFLDRDAFSWRDGYVHTSPVGKFKANAFGFHDMIGNASEWTSSKNGGYPYKADDGREEMAEAVPRVIRGGGFNSPPEYCRYANRGAPPSDYRGFGNGFRIVVDTERESPKSVRHPE